MTEALSAAFKRDLLELIDARWDWDSLVISAQLAVQDWHAYFGDPAVADAILDRLVHRSRRLELQGESMRKLRAREPSAGLT